MQGQRLLRAGAGIAERGLRATTMLAEYAGAVALGLIVVFYCYEVFMRYALNAPTRWAHDFVAYALCIGTLLLLPAVTRRHGHVAITIVPDMLRGRVQDLFGRFIALVAAVICLIVAWYALQEVLRQYDRDIRTIATIRLPKWWISAAIPFGFFLSGLEFLRHAILGRSSLTVEAED